MSIKCYVTDDRNLSITFLHSFPQCPFWVGIFGNCVNESDFSFCDALVLHGKPSTRLQVLVGETNVNVAPPLSKPEDYNLVSTFFTSLDKILAETENRFSGNDQDVLCALSDITLSYSPTSHSSDLFAKYYDLDKELLQADQGLFSQFKTARIKKNSNNSCRNNWRGHWSIAENSLLEMTPEFYKVASILAVIPTTSWSAERLLSQTNIQLALGGDGMIKPTRRVSNISYPTRTRRIIVK